MFFIVDKENKVILGWSAKCACSHIKRIYWYLQNGDLNNRLHYARDYGALPNDVREYTIIMVGRNPYKRLVSGFLEKYNKNGQFRNLWKHEKLTFSKFVNEIINRNWKMIDRHHFTLQTSERFDIKIFGSKCFKFFDVANIDYEFIEKLYNKKIPEELIKFKGGHERKKKDTDINEYVYDMEQEEYIESNVDYKYFYNDELKKKIYNFYMNDFIYFDRVFHIKYNL